ncbi:MAG: XrtA/PEP-CTERM system histidine kinase PrsK [Verrucomicrobiota bacterium]
MNAAYILAVIGAVLCLVLAIGAGIRAQRSIARWFFVAGLVVLAVESLCNGLSAASDVPGRIVWWQQWRHVALALLPGLWLGFSLSYSRGNAREQLRKWRALVAAAILIPVGIAVGFRKTLISEIGLVEATNHWLLRFDAPGLALHFMVVIGAVVVLMNLERTFRESVGMMRWRIKYMILGVGVLFGIRLYTSSQAMLFGGMDLFLEHFDSGALIVACLLMLRASLRSGYFDVDLYPSQAVLRSSVTILLTGVYLVIVGALAKIVSVFGGDAYFALKTFLILISLVLLAVWLVSDRARLLTARLVSEHFRRPFYDYRQIWKDFTDATAVCVNQPQLCQAVVKWVADKLQVLSVTIWLVDDKQEGLNFAASTFLTEAKAVELRPRGALVVEALRALREHPEPFDTERSATNWAAMLRQAHPDEFHKGGGRVCVPISGGGRVLGVLILGDRVSGLPFSEQDLGLLKCIGSQFSACLLNIQLSEKLLQAKELEAFQTMSAFFVHDLKNTASTLNLMLKNLPVHFADPAFREDALRGVAKTVSHINDVIGRLSQLRQELKLRPSEADLNELVERVVNAAPPGAAIVVTKDLQPVPRLVLDPEQIARVVTNLVLNATDACNGQGQIRVATAPVEGGAVLTVTDTGCGMTAEFLNQSLFRPFQTTKPRGLGIGMFQSKMIVQAHGGRIDVQSELGKGTTFRVFLPRP